MLYYDSEYELWGDGDSDAVRAKAELPPKVKKEGELKREPKLKKEPKSRAATSVKKETSIKKESGFQESPSRKPANVPVGLINGVYDITCLKIENEWDCDHMTLTLTLDSPVIWGAYDFSMFSGILYIPQRPFSTLEGAKHFSWRGRDSSEGIASFGDGNTGEIRFLGNGRVEGWINL